MKKAENLDCLLFSSSHYEQEQSSIQNARQSLNNMPELMMDNNDKFLQDQCEYIQQGRCNWSDMEDVKYHFPQVNAPSVEFSQNSMMSKRYDEDSIRGGAKHYKMILQDKKKEEKQVQEIIEQEIKQMSIQIQKKDLEIGKQNTIIEGYKLRINNQATQIAQLQSRIIELQENINSKEQAQIKLYKLLTKKDETFTDYKKAVEDLTKDNLAKDNMIDNLRHFNQELEQQVEILKKNISLYTNSDSNLYDFKPIVKSQKSMDLQMQKQKSLQEQKQLEKLRRQRANLQTEMIMLKSKIDEKQIKNTRIEEQYRKKVNIKEKKVIELEQKLAFSTENKSRVQLSLQSTKDELIRKNKQINEKNQNMAQLDKRFKIVSEELKKKEEKIKQISLEIIQKNKQLQNLNKQNNDMKIKSDFDHHCLNQKDQKIHILEDEYKDLREQIKKNKEEISKMEKNATERIGQIKLKKDNEKLKNQNENYRKEKQKIDKEVTILQKQHIEKDNSLKEYKKRIEEMTRKMKILKDQLNENKLQIQTKHSQICETKEIIKKNNKDSLDYKHLFKKKEEENIQLKNRLIIMESTIKKREQEEEDSYQYGEQSFDHKQHIQALEQRLQEREKQLKQFKNLQNGNKIQVKYQIEDVEALKEQILDKDEQLYKLEEQLNNKEQEIQQLQAELLKKQQDLQFRQKSLDFMHQKFLELETDKIEKQAEKKVSLSFYEQSLIEDRAQFWEQNIKLYQHQIQRLEAEVSSLTKKNREKEDKIAKLSKLDNSGDHKFEIRRLKQQIKELKELALSRDRRITPQSLSRQETIEFLLRTLKKIIHSSDMLKLLNRHSDLKLLLRQILTRIDKSIC